MRGNEITFISKGLCPDKSANVFFDKTNVNNFTQKSNKLTLTSTGTFLQDEAIINTTTNAYAKVVTSSNNVIYLNQNFINVNIAPYAGNVLSSTTLSEQAIIYQTETDKIHGKISFVGAVERYENSNSTHAYLAIRPITGSFRKFTANSLIFLRNDSTLRLNISPTQTTANNFPPASNVYSKTDLSKTAVVSAHDHFSGAIQFAPTISTTQIHVTDNLINSVGNTITISSGVSLGQTRVISAVSANGLLVTLNSAIAVSSNSKYSYGSHVVDDFGTLCGLFHIPETADVNFAVGKRLLTITDAASSDTNDYIMRAYNYYSVTGNQFSYNDYARLAYDSISPSRDVAINREDIYKNNRKFFPLAQTFFTPGTANVHASGVSTELSSLQLSRVDLFFAQKPTNEDLQLPVKVTINEVENGLPTTKVLGQTIINAMDVNTSTIPDVTSSSTITAVKFFPPVIVKPSREYAITVTTSSPDYALFVAEIGGAILGTTPARRVSEQPYIGEFFKAQNASNWNAIPNEDLMFRVHYSNWSTTSNNIIFNTGDILSNVNVDSILVHSIDYNFKPTSVDYYFKSTNINGVQDADWISIRKDNFYEFSSDLSTSVKDSSRRRRLIAGNNNSFLIKAEFNTSDSYSAPALDTESIAIIAKEYMINDAGIENKDFSLTNLGQHANAANITVTFSAPDRADGTTANAYVAALSAVTGFTGNVSLVVIDNPGSGYYRAPTVTFSEAAAAVNATAVVAGENGSSGGNCLARYISKMVTLADGFDAGDLRVFLDCNRPVGTDVVVYYKIKSGEDSQSFEEKRWQLMTKVNNNFSKDNLQMIELEYRPSLDVNQAAYTEDGVSYPIGGKFKYYAIKIVLVTSNKSVIPCVSNYRAIATPSG